MEPLTLRELTTLLSAANDARRKGVSVEAISAQLSEGLDGLTYEELLEQVKAAPREVADPPPTVGEKALQVAQGASLGFLDDFVDLLSTTGGRIDRREELEKGPRVLAGVGERIRETMDRLRRNDPLGSFATEAIGGTLSGVGLASALGKTRAVKELSGGQRIARTTGAGSLFGAAAGVGEGESLGERAVLGAAGGIAGSFLGLGLSAAGEGARMVGGKILQKVAPKFVAGQQAKDALRRTANEVGLSPEEFRANATALEAMRPGRTIPADVAPAFSNILEDATTLASPSRAARVAEVAGRGAGARARITQDVEELVPFGPITTAIERAELRVKAISNKLFKPFDPLPVDRHDIDLNIVLKQPLVAKVWKTFPESRGNEPLTMKTLRGLRSRLNSKAAKATRGGDAGVANELRAQARELDAVLENIIPEFRAANLAYYEAQRTIDAFGDGAKAYKSRLFGERLAREISEGMDKAGSQADEWLQAYRHGALDEALNALGKVSDAEPGRAALQLRGAIGEGEATVLRNIFESQGTLEEMVQRLYLEERFTVMKNLQIRSRLFEQSTQDILGRMKDAQVQGRTAALMSMLNQASPEVAQELSTVIVDFLTTPGASTVARLTEVLSKPIYDSFFRAAISRTAGLAGAVGTELDRTSEALGPLIDLIDSAREQFPADALRQRQ